MIEVRYQGRLGNNLFQYVAGRIVQARTGAYLDAVPRPYNHIERFTRKFLNFTGYVTGPDYQEPVLIDNSWDRISPLAFASHPKKVILKGLFLHYDNVRDWRPQIREWLAFAPAPFRPHPADLVVNVRLGDAKHCQGGRVLPFSYYREVIERAQPRRVYIVSDEPMSSYIQQFAPYDPHVFDLSPFDCLRCVAAFNRICLPLSTFSWWGAFLSDASEVYYPLVDRFPIFSRQLRVGLPSYRNIPCDNPIPWDEPVLYSESRSFRGFDGMEN